MSTVQTSGNLFWPRVLIEGSFDRDGDGVSDGSMSCYDPIDCTQKCRYLERTSRHGAGAPPTCALCDQVRDTTLPKDSTPTMLTLPCHPVTRSTAATTSSPPSWTSRTRSGRTCSPSAG